MREQTNKILKTLCVYMLVISMMLSSVAGSWQVMAAGIATPLKITSAEAGSKEVKGSGLLGTNRRKNNNIMTTIYVTVKNGDTLIEEASTVIEPTNKTKEWTVTLQNELVDGYTVYAKQKCNNDMSDEVSVVAKESSASKHKDTLKMPTGEIWIEQTSSNQVNEDEQAEAVELFNNVNTAIAGDIKSVKFSINTAEHAYYEVTYTDNSTSGKVEATNLKIKQVEEYSRGAELGSITIVDNVIKGQLSGEGPFDGIKVQILLKLSDAVKDSYCDKGECKVDKDTSKPVDATVDSTTGEFSYTIPNPNLELDQKVGVTVKEPHKFKSCSQTAVTAPIPKKTDVKDPKKLTAEDKKAIDAAIRSAYIVNGESKLPNGTGDYDGVPAVIQIDDSGNVKIFRGNDVAGTWDWNNDGIFVPEKNEDGSVKLKEGAQPTATFLAKELVKNLPPDTPKMENKDGKVVVTPNIEVDTDAKKVVVEYEGADGKTTITATKTDTGWTVDNDKAKVDENGVVTIPTKEIKTGTKVIASVEDDGGLVPEEKALDSGKAELLIENKYKVTYDAGEGSGTMADEEVEAGKNYTILDNAFTAPTDKEFDHWMIGFEPKKPGETTEVNNDITIKAIWKYIINPKVEQIVTTLKHPVNYEMYKKAISGFPSALTVEHIEVKNAPDITKVGGTSAEIEIRFSDGQFRTVTVPVDVQPDPKDAKIKELNEKIDGLNKDISEKDAKITELNDKITELEKKLKTCQEQCAADKAQCEKDKKALQEQINTLAKEKSNLEIQVKENRELIEQLRKEIAGLNKQVEDWKKIAGDKDTKIKELENSIKELNTKLETANTANTELKEKLATANQKITDLESKITDLEGQVKDLTEKLNAKETEIKTLNDTITTLKEKIATLEAEKAKDKEAYEKEKANLEKQVQDAKDSLTTKETELNSIKEELKTANNDLAAEKAKTSGLTEQVKAKDEKIADLEKQIADLKKKAEEAGNNNTTIIKEKETIIEKLTSEKAELEKQLATEKAKNEMLEKQITDLNKKADKASEDLNNAKTKISDLEKQLAVEQEKNSKLTAEVEKLTKELNEKKTEVNTLTDKVTELEKQVSEKTAQGVADKAEIERLKAELAELKNKLQTKSDEADKLSKEIVTLKETVKTLEGEKTELTNNVKRLEKEVAELKQTIKTSSDRIIELEKENATLKADNKNLTDKVAELNKQVEDAKTENTTLKTKIDELNAKIAELEKTQCDVEELNKLKQEKAALEAKLEGKDELIQELRNQIAELKEKVKEIDTLKDKIKELEIKIVNLTNENNKLKEDLNTANAKIAELQKSLDDEKAKNEALEKDKANLEKDKATLEKDKAGLQDALKKSEDEKAKLQGEKDALEEELNKLKEDLSKCPADQTEKVKELEKQISEKENQISEKIKDIAAKDAKITELSKALAGANDKIADLNKKLIDLASQPREKEYIYIRDNYTPSYNGDVYSLNLEIEALRRENRELKDKIAKLSQGQDCSLMAKERFVTIFSLKSMLYKTYLGDELMTQAEMMDLKGFIEPFISNNRTMLPLRYVALSLGLDVDWNHSTRTATFTNRDSSNALNPGKITINANTLEMKDQYGNKIAVDSKPMLKNGRFYISITNLTKAFGGTNGNLADGVRNTIEWDSQGRRVLVYKYSK